MPIPGNLLTTAMAVMPHTDVDRALEMALEVASELCDKFEAGHRDDEIARLMERAAGFVERSPHLLGHRARLAASEGDTVAAKRDLKRAKRLEARLPVYERVEKLLKPQRSSWWRW